MGDFALCGGVWPHPTPERETRVSRYLLVYRFEHVSDWEVVLEFYDDGLVWKGFKDREDQLPATLRLEK